MKIKQRGWFYLLWSGFFLVACAEQPTEHQSMKTEDGFVYKTEQFADLAILRYKVDGFDELTLKQKELVYYLYEAALSGRDIIYDQNYKHNLRIRRTLDGIVSSYSGDKSSKEYEQFITYVKRVWFSNGIHHHYSTKKLVPEFSESYFSALVEGTPETALPLLDKEDKKALTASLVPLIFNQDLDAKRVNQDPGEDLALSSANNYYEGVTQKEVEAFYKKKLGQNEEFPVMYGLNSKLVKEGGQVVEKAYKVGGLYSPAIERIVFWLKKASEVAENAQQKAALDKLIEYYETGDLKKFDEYNVEWVKDTASVVDAVNGFIEVYGDALGFRGAFESVVSIRDKEASIRMAALSKNAQWFEDNSPIEEAHKKKEVTGISYKVITVIVESGDAAPSTPIGINLPNSDWIRKVHGSKSVSLGNIKDSYNKASSGGSIDEFSFSEEEATRAREHGVLSANLHTALHEVIGHASGQLMPGVPSPSEALKNYASPLEEARADLVALYYLYDQKMVDIGVMPSLEVGKAQYDSYINNGLMLQLNRIEPGENIEQAHMRNRQMVAKWVYEKGMVDNVIEKKIKGNKTYFVVNDYEKLRGLFGQLLKEVQRVKSEGDYESGKNLIENYGVIVDQDMLKEVQDRFGSLGNAPYSGFIQPKLVPVYDGDMIVDVVLEQPEDFTQQMLEYGENYSFLPHYN